MAERLGISGRIAERFQNTEITPLLALLGLPPALGAGLQTATLVARLNDGGNGGVTVRNGFMCNSKEGIFNFLVLLAMMEQLGLDWSQFGESAQRYFRPNAVG